MITIWLDTDPTKKLTTQLAEYSTVEQLSYFVSKKFGMDELLEKSYGFKEKGQGLLI